MIHFVATSNHLGFSHLPHPLQLGLHSWARGTLPHHLDSVPNPCSKRSKGPCCRQGTLKLSLSSTSPTFSIQVLIITKVIFKMKENKTLSNAFLKVFRYLWIRIRPEENFYSLIKNIILKLLFFFCYLLAYYSYILTIKGFISKNNIFLYVLSLFSLPGSVPEPLSYLWYGSGSG